LYNEFSTTNVNYKKVIETNMCDCIKLL